MSRAKTFGRNTIMIIRKTNILRNAVMLMCLAISYSRNRNTMMVTAFNAAKLATIKRMQSHASATRRYNLRTLNLSMSRNPQQNFLLIGIDKRSFKALPGQPNKYPNFRVPSSSCLLSTKSDESSSVTTKFSDDSYSEVKRRYVDGNELFESNIASIPKNIDKILSDLETESSDPTFWDADQKERNSYVTSQISYYSRLQSRVAQWKSNKEDCEVAMEMLDSSLDDDLFSAEERQSLFEELQTAAEALLEDGERFQLELLLSGPYDNQPCRLVLTAGAGGTEANDWVADLKRMYERHAEKMGFTIKVEDESPGEVVGYKSVELLISDGPGHPYGWFKSEKGAHRLVRLSPFNANNKRQTTFAGVDVAPILTEQDLSDITIPDKDLEITTMRSGGAGGQNVNKVNSAVRIKHLPSGLNVKCTQERSQAMNKDLALKRLKGQLLAIAKEQRVQEIQQIRGDQVEASWGAQVRNYVLHPYKMVKDQRSGWETSNAQNFLDGDLEDCIASLLRHRAKEEQEQQQQEGMDAQ